MTAPGFPHERWTHRRQQPPAAMPPYGYGYPPPQSKKGVNGVVIAAIIGAVVIAFIVFIAPPFIFLDKMSSDATDMVKDSSGGNTEQILDNDLDVTFGTFTRDMTYTTLKTGKLPVSIHNKGEKRATYSVQIEALDTAGNRITEDTVYVQNLAPGQSVTKDAFTFSDEDNYAKLTHATFNVAGVSKF